MWSIFNPKPECASAAMQGFARQLLSYIRQHLSEDRYENWLTVPVEMTGKQVKELGMAFHHSWDGEYYVTCCFHNSSEHFGGSNVITRGTKEQIISWLSDDKNIEAIAMMLQDLYENTHTWD